MAHTPRFVASLFSLRGWVHHLDTAGVSADIFVSTFFFQKKKYPLALLIRAQNELEFLYFPITDGAVAKDRYVRDFVGKLLARIHAGELDGKREGGWGIALLAVQGGRPVGEYNRRAGMRCC